MWTIGEKTAMRRIGCVLSTLLLVGCANMALTPGGARVITLAETPEGCEPLGRVYGQVGGSWTLGKYATKRTLNEGAEFDARNRAADLGATHIVPDEREKSDSTSMLSAYAYRCD